VDSATARNVDAPPSNGADITTPLDNKQPPKSDTPLKSVGDNAPVELTPAETALLRENEVSAKLATLAATKAALTAALNAQLADHHQRPNHLNTVPVGNGVAIFHKMHAKSIPPLPLLNPSIGSAVAFLRAAGKLASNGDFTMAIQAIVAHAQELAIVTIANTANSVTFAGWNSTQRAVLNHCVTAPGPCASAENDLRECPGRLQHESFDTYYTRFQTKYEVCIYVRNLFNELKSSD
jgi:hypothetical protein